MLIKLDSYCIIPSRRLLAFLAFLFEKKKNLDQLFESRDIKKPDAFFAEMTEMMVGPPRLKEVLTLKQNLKGIQMCKQASFMKILKEAKEGQAVYVSQGGATVLARTIYDLEIDKKKKLSVI